MKTRLCHCGQPARGLVPDDDVPADAKYSALTHHDCRQCSPGHCLLGQALAQHLLAETEPVALELHLAKPALF